MVQINHRLVRASIGFLQEYTVFKQFQRSSGQLHHNCFGTYKRILSLLSRPISLLLDYDYQLCLGNNGNEPQCNPYGTTPMPLACRKWTHYFKKPATLHVSAVAVELHWSQRKGLDDYRPKPETSSEGARRPIPGFRV